MADEEEPMTIHDYAYRGELKELEWLLDEDPDLRGTTTTYREDVLLAQFLRQRLVGH